MKVLVCGKGEIGSGLGEILAFSHGVTYLDPQLKLYAPPRYKADVIHICFPIKSVKEFTPLLHYCKAFTVIIIDATVPIDLPMEIQKQAGDRLVLHSPVRALHPNIQSGLRKYTKFVGPADPARHDETLQFCHEYYPPEIRFCILHSSRETAAGKLWDTTWYLTQIVLCNQIAVYCAKNGLKFSDVYTQFQQTGDTGAFMYENGRAIATKLFPRPVMIPGGIGGHCLMPNLEILKEDISPAFYSWIQQMDNYFKNTELQEYFKKNTGIPPVVIDETEEVGNPN